MSSHQFGESSAPLEWHQSLRQHLGHADVEEEGLRERKKRLMRQQISNTATFMFLERGFDAVRITEVASVCGVSEKTIYNYFPTKESLILDREDEMTEEIQRVLGSNAATSSPVDAIVDMLRGQLTALTSFSTDAGRSDMAMMRRFTDLVDQTPALRAAQFDMTERLAQVAARTMATRAGVDPDDPEPQIAADALLGLWRVFFRATIKYSDEGADPSAFEAAVMKDVQRAARLIDTGLWSFGMAVQGTNGRDQLKAAAEASNEARKQVVSALKQSRDAWRQIKTDIQGHVHDERDAHRGNRAAHEQKIRDAAQKIRREAQATRQAAQRQKREAQQARQQSRRKRPQRP